MAWAVQRFWKRRAAPLVPSRSLGHLRSSKSVGGLGPEELPDAGLPASRYESDFAELRQLGRGGYGVVVAGAPPGAAGVAGRGREAGCGTGTSSPPAAAALRPRPLAAP